MSSKRKSLKPSTPGPKDAAPLEPSAQFSIEYAPGAPPMGGAGYVFVSPLEMTARQLLPDDDVLVVDKSTGVPLISGRAWPQTKQDRTRVKVQCLELPTPAGQSQATDRVVDIVTKAGFLGPKTVAAVSINVIRPASALGTAAGAPLRVLQGMLIGSVVPLAGAVLELDGIKVQLRPQGTEDAQYFVVQQGTVFVEGPGRAMARVPVAPVPIAADGGPQEADGHASPPQKQASRELIGGLNEQATELEGLIRAAMASSPAVSDGVNGSTAGRRAFRAARGALLVGPPGTGKTLLARAVADKLGLRLHVVNGPEVLSAVVGESESTLRKVFKGSSGGLLFLDEIDGLAPARSAGQAGGNELETRLVATLLTLMDGLQSDVPARGSGDGSAAAPSSSPGPALVRLIDSAQLQAEGTQDAAGKGSNESQKGGSGSSSAKAGSPSGPVFIVAATNRASAVEPALRRPGRFDREIAIPIPSAAARADILRVSLSSYPHTLSPVDISSLADGMHGYVGADIAAVCREAALAALQRSTAVAGRHVNGKVGSATVNDGADTLAASLSAMTITDGPALDAAAPPTTEGARTAVRPSTVITMADMRSGLRMVQPSAIREISVEVPKVTWTDIGGQEDVKIRLQEAVEWPLTHADAFEALGIRPPRGVLLYGPPGCSKTMMARAMASSGRMNFIGVKGPELLSKYVGDSEKAVAEVFHRARAASPCVVFFDEFDSLAPRRGGRSDGGGSSVSVRVVSQLLTELDGISSLKQVVVVAATNRPDLIDPALLRPGRVDRLLYVGLPDAPARAAIVTKRVQAVPSAPELQGPTGTDNIARVCADGGPLDGYSGAELVGILREAALLAVKEAAFGLSHAVPAARGVAADAVEPCGGDAGSVLQSNPAVPGPRLRLEHITAAASKMPRGVTTQMIAFYDKFKRGISG